MKIVKTASIPNVDDGRLLDSLQQTHDRFHTVAGIIAHDGPRRDLINNGVRGLKIRDELRSRGVPTGIPGCRFCSDE